MHFLLRLSLYPLIVILAILAISLFDSFRVSLHRSAQHQHTLVDEEPHQQAETTNTENLAMNIQQNEPQQPKNKTLLAQQAAERHKNLARLIETLTGPSSGYNKTVIPATLEGDLPFNVHCRLFLIRIQEVIENYEAMVTTARLQLSWNDSALRWNPEDFGGITEVILPPEQIWTPDLQVANSVDDLINIDYDHNFRYRVKHDGRVWFHPSGKFHTKCQLNLRLYPFDYQRCAIILEAVTYTASELKIIPRPDKADLIALGMYSENPMWSLEQAHGFGATYMTSRTTGFSRIQFYLILKRKPDYYVRTFFVPLVLLSVLQVLTYLMPIKFVDRIPQATVVILTAFFFQGQLSEKLPHTSEDMSFLQIYINLILGVSVLTVSICIISLELIDPDDGLPLWGLFQLFRKTIKNQVRRSLSVRTSASPEEMRPVLANEREGDDEENEDEIWLANVKQKPPPSSCHFDLKIDMNGQTSLASKRSLKRISSIRQNRGYTLHRSASTHPENVPLTNKTVLAAVINWFGVLLTLIISLIYPLCVLTAMAYGADVPTIPTPSENNTTVNYY